MCPMCTILQSSESLCACYRPLLPKLLWREGLQPREGSTVRAKILPKIHKTFYFPASSELFLSPLSRVSGCFAQPDCRDRRNGRLYAHAGGSSRLLASMFTVASRFRRLKFVGSYLSTIEAVGTGSWLSVVQVLLDVSIALLVAIIEFHGGIHRGYRTISSEFFFVKRYMQDHLDRVSSWRKNLRLHWDPPKFFFQVEKSTTPIKKSFGG